MILKDFLLFTKDLPGDVEIQGCVEGDVGDTYDLEFCLKKEIKDEKVVEKIILR